MGTRYLCVAAVKVTSACANAVLHTTVLTADRVDHANIISVIFAILMDLIGDIVPTTASGFSLQCVVVFTPV